MSTTIPLTLIEGSMPLPSLSPLGRLLPAPFGRDWALLPPAYSLRAELEALYAAVLRTFCLNAETIRALCQWESLRKPPVASPGSALPAPSTTVFDLPADEASRTFAETAAFSTVSAPSVPASPRGGSMHWGALAGSACALGGAAMLAWVAFGHLSQRQAISEVKLATNAPVRQEAQLASRHSPDVAALPYADANNRAAASAPGAASLPVDVASVAGASGSVSTSEAASPDTSSQALAATPRRDFTASPATGIVTTVKAAPPHATAGRNVSRRRDKLRESAPSRDERNGRSSQAIIATQVSPQLPSQLPSISPTNYDVPQITVPAAAQRTSPKPSTAGPYSPLAPSQLGTEEYASMTMSAGTHLRNIAPPSRPASSINPPENAGTEWVNQMSHRRVTEVPDQFAK
ncbi:hypothetical protein B0G76_0692 [Paraburkholderia sp. BL23I1N1]|uniref:hypothetical protein n=1 Tax=Paraburkholderia sp. BL23I1N1 TaxID=1938802 RepID=UPI000E76AEBD|nr:hypothetical protein [Paraburkholderia sp. BL23I1N1]RKE34675.1 hypothetical protein B0G76_0692 [Paraburkholderia sp. BL23I1N1]